MDPCKFYKCLADVSRLKSLLLVSEVEEACVCDLMQALELDQPRTSRHLAQLRRCGILLDERRGKWVYYKLHPDLPQWAHKVIRDTAKHNPDYFSGPLQRLRASKLAASACS
ncbi:metalloregulator ArsR/SmtB family transcription factor [Aliiglaciecola sp. LCG003]|uniref:metalloregulator ArsR/SmtB family transcription factor n=1 Tax=Aliiglaciecola sp. LCG003 TaxID=3053655 RepID=UPI002572E635|nr:metalloregulator ArsR/SmtB family transcription factor [Aliiglaciecola sp. LCG003]WJG10425.1 metalloregulator ArsR/SmtB family transcription factor [Aliiglaciecola sp. LCG003]